MQRIMNGGARTKPAPSKSPERQSNEGNPTASPKNDREGASVQP